MRVPFFPVCQTQFFPRNIFFREEQEFKHSFAWQVRLPRIETSSPDDLQKQEKNPSRKIKEKKMLIWLLKTPTYDERRRLVSWKSHPHTFPFLFACHPGKLSSFLTLFWNWNSRRIYRRILLLDLPPTHAKIIQAKFQEERASKNGDFVPLTLWPRTI